MNRRRFLQCFGGAAGGLFLAACSSGQDRSVPLGSTAILPNGYRFQALVATGSGLPGSGAAPSLSFGEFPGSAYINEAGQVYVHNLDSQGAMGLYRLKLDWSTAPPTVASIEAVARDGQTMADGGTLAHVGLASTNGKGHTIVSATLADANPALYFSPDSSTVMPAVTFNAAAQGTGGNFSNDFGDFELQEDDGLLMSAAFYTTSTTQAEGKEGLFLLPQANQSSSGRLLAASGDVLPGTSQPIGGFGLLDGDGLDPDYLSEVYLNSSDDAPSDGTELVVANTFTNPTPRILVAHSRVQLSNAIRARTLPGTPALAPRLGNDGNLATILRTDTGADVFSYKGNNLLTAGASTPLGRTVSGFCAPTVGPPGTAYVVAFTADGGAELLVTDGNSLRTILSDGSVLGGKALSKIALGVVRGQADSKGNLVLVVGFADNTQALVLGQPV